MIISTVLTAACFILIIFEALSMLAVFRSCRNVKCRVNSSEKVSVREDGFLIREYWKTEVDFTLSGIPRSATLETSTFCQKGQMLGCYYYPKRDLVFRKRDVRSVLRARSITAFSVGVLFLLLNLLFHMTSLGGIIIAHAFEAAAIILTVVFASFGIGFIVYSANAMRHTGENRVTEVYAEVIDIVRVSKRHRETQRFMYYPIYRYKLGDRDHVVRSKIGRESPPKMYSRETVLADTKKGGLVQYKDVNTSFILGFCFLLIAGLLVYSTAFL